jgi:site-specific recombinase XerD
MLIHHAIRSLRELCALRHLSLNTEKSYVHWLGRYGLFLKDPKFRNLTPERKMEAFLTHLALSGVSGSTQNQAFNALLCFYRDVLKQELGPVNSLRAKQSASIRQCPAQEEVSQLLSVVSDLYNYPTRLIVHLLYACGLRVSEPLNLRIKDLDLKQSRLYIHQSKGNKGRVVLFPRCLAEPLEQQLVKGRKTPRLLCHDACSLSGFGRVSCKKRGQSGVRSGSEALFFTRGGIWRLTWTLIASARGYSECSRS